jgi:pyruvate/2-oxoglutarate dehydrogenase complex dihydrolipoamide acyltransferase (E2) component
LTELVGFLGNIGINCKALGIERNAFGTLMVTSIGGEFKIEDAYAPLLSFTHCVGVATICSSQKKIIYEMDGSSKEDELMTINFALDHRYVDGVLISKVIKAINQIVENPDEIFTD